MLRNFLRISARHLWHQKGYTALNVGGLAVSMATCLLIGLYIQDELSYDDFHPRADRIQIVMVGDSADRGPRTPYPLGSVLANEVPGVKRVTQTSTDASARSVRYNTEGRRIQRTLEILQADSSFFRVFNGFPLLHGRRTSVLDAPAEAVITQSTAENFFGTDNPTGRTLTVEGDSLRRYTVVGVTSVPTNSTVKFDMVTSLPAVPANTRTSWADFTTRTYARVEEGVRSHQLAETATRAAPLDQAHHVSALSAMSLPDFYLSDEYYTGGFRGEARYIYIFGTVALLVLLIAMVNFVNLVTAQVQRRSREVGVRKAMGARRTQVARQFLTETLLLSGLALTVAIALVSITIPAFNVLFGKSLSLGAARHGWTLLGGVVILLTVTILGGFYPALVLSGFRPTRILRESSATTTTRGGWLQKGLVVTQFAMSAGLILGTTVIYQQLDYVQTKDLGFDGEQVVKINLSELSENQRQLVRREVRRSPHVTTASVGSLAPGEGTRFAFARTPTELSPEARESNENIFLRGVQVDTSYVETLGLTVLAGRNFGGTPAADPKETYILNQAAATAMGWNAEDAIGKPFGLNTDASGGTGVVVGVIENFHLTSLRQPIAPVILSRDLGHALPQSILVASLAPAHISAGMEHLRDVVSSVVPDAEFSYTFLDDEFDAMYRSERRLAQIFATFAGIAIVVACLGLFGLAAFAVQRRTREIGVRKALGASVTNIVGLLSKEYAIIVAVSLVVGLPTAYVWIQRWLQNFAYQVDLGMGTFAFTAGLVVGVAALTVSYHAIKAARIDPAITLRDE